MDWDKKYNWSHINCINDIFRYEAEEYFDHNPKSEGVVFIMIDKSDLINEYEIDDNCDFSIVELVHNEIDESDLSDNDIDKLLNKGDK
jgi:hypothetical protein